MSEEVKKENKATTQLPSSVKQEKSILSSIFQDSEGLLLDKAIEQGLTEEDFYIPAHGRVFRYIIKKFNAGEPFDIITATDDFTNSRLIDHLGGPSDLTELFCYSPSSAFFDSHLKSVLDKSDLRKLIKSCKKLSDKAYENPKNVSEFVDDAESEIFSIRRGSADSIPTAEDLTRGVVDEFISYVKGKSNPIGLETRFELLNTMTQGLKPGELFILAARPSVGKTAIACNFVEDFIDYEKRGMVFSLEMTDQQVIKRITYAKANFPLILLKPGYQPTKSEIEGLERSIKVIKDAELWIDDTPQISLMEIRAKARRRIKESGLDYIIVDYLQLMRGDSSYGREREIAQISSGFKALAKELKVPIIVLAQLNRNAELRAGGEPRMADLRESGAIEQDADYVALLHRSDYQAPDDTVEESDGKIILAKNRNGPTGIVPIKFHKKIMSFK